MGGKRKLFFDTLFAFFHLLLLAGALGYAFISLARGNTIRFALITACLLAYYFLALHRNVKQEIRRKKQSRSKKP